MITRSKLMAATEAVGELEESGGG